MSSLPRKRKFAFLAAISVLGLFGLGLYKADGIRKKLEYAMLGPQVVDWASARPEHEGLDPEVLDDLTQSLARRNTDAFLVVRGGNIVAEWYAPDFDTHVQHYTAALAKAITASVTLLVALSGGAIDLEDHLWEYAPSLANDPMRSKIRIKDLLFHQSGIEDVDFFVGQKGELEGWKKEYYENRSTRFEYSMHVAPMKFDPGTRGEYSGVGYYALAYAVTKSLSGTEYQDIKSLLRERVMRPLEIPENNWSLNYGESYEIDGMTLYAFGSGAGYTARAAARIGELILNQGQWNGHQIIDPTWLDEILARNQNHTLVSTNHGWHLNTNGGWSSLPKDAIFGKGGGPQIVLVIPSLDLVMVRFGESLATSGEDQNEAISKHLFRPLLSSINGPSNRQKSLSNEI